MLTHQGETTPIDNADDDLVDDCPKCGGTEYEKLVGMPAPIMLGGAAGVGKHFPYFDHSLGIMIESSTHRREVGKRLGLVPLDGPLDHRETPAERAFHASADAGKKALEDQEKSVWYNQMKDKIGEVDPKSGKIVIRRGKYESYMRENRARRGT